MPILADCRGLKFDSLGADRPRLLPIHSLPWLAAATSDCGIRPPTVDQSSHRMCNNHTFAMPFPHNGRVLLVGQRQGHVGSYPGSWIISTAGRGYLNKRMHHAVDDLTSLRDMAQRTWEGAKYTGSAWSTDYNRLLVACGLARAVRTAKWGITSRDMAQGEASDRRVLLRMVDPEGRQPHCGHVLQFAFGCRNNPVEITRQSGIDSSIPLDFTGNHSIMLSMPGEGNAWLGLFSSSVSDRSSIVIEYSSIPERILLGGYQGAYGLARVHLEDYIPISNSEYVKLPTVTVHAPVSRNSAMTKRIPLFTFTRLGTLLLHKITESDNVLLGSNFGCSALATPDGHICLKPSAG